MGDRQLNIPSDNVLPALWEEHTSIPFPPDCRGKVISNVDLIALDYTSAGCISTYLDRGSLDQHRLSVLGLCYHGLANATGKLEGSSFDYFRRLETMTGIVLIAIRDSTVLE